jgi:hypothetical protein
LSSESQEQIGLVQWFRLKFPNVLIYHIPNGGQRNIRTGIRFKSEGVVAGIPDLHIPDWSLWIEMKRKDGGTVSYEQKKIHTYLKGIGHTVIIGNGAEDASRKILEFLKERNL